MQIKKSEHGCLAVSGVMETAGVPADALVNITGDYQFDIAGAGEAVHGYVSVPAKDTKEEDAEVTVDMAAFRRLFTAKAVGSALTAGAKVTPGAPATGNISTVKAAGSDPVCGVVIQGADENGTVHVLGY
ncbi:MAG: hypothetical protein AB7J13_17155 [Pyrinomonadaceae bacterium]